MKKTITLPRLLPGKEFTRRGMEFLTAIQKELMPEHASKIVAINVETGEYTLGEDITAAALAFRKRWPNEISFGIRVDGGPVVKFHGM